MESAVLLLLAGPFLVGWGISSSNIRIASFPDLLAARLMGLGPREMFQVCAFDREDVQVRFP
jgi:hypothetical protein